MSNTQKQIEKMTECSRFGKRKTEAAFFETTASIGSAPFHNLAFSTQGTGLADKAVGWNQVDRCRFLGRFFLRFLQILIGSDGDAGG